MGAALPMDSADPFMPLSPTLNRSIRRGYVVAAAAVAAAAAAGEATKVVVAAADFDCNPCAENLSFSAPGVAADAATEQLSQG